MHDRENETKLCPFCGAPMEAGTMRNITMFFLPKGEKTPRTIFKRSFEKHRAIRFPPYMEGARLLYDEECFPAAWVCRSCRFVLVPYEDQWHWGYHE